ncbi:MAG: hypothetical protein JXO22_05115 [Phycisphaerae bacterium]|nr:hypothetical protein [Phycisphaerae bacterium]
MTAIALVLALGLAWLQLSGRRALQDETAIDGTPLVVRPPRDWLRNEQEPGKFFLPAPTDRSWRGIPFTKQITFEYHRLSDFISPVTYERSAPASLAGLPAVQTRLPDEEEQTRRRNAAQVIERVAVSPRGDVIRVELQTLTGVTMADVALLDVVADSVRVEAPGMSVKPADALARAGVTVPIDASWVAAVPTYDEVAACYVGGSIEGMPVWSVGIMRTWLAHKRTLVNLLEDFASLHWGRAPREISIETFTRDDGAVVAHLRPLGQHRHPIAGVWAVARSDSQVALLPVYANLEIAIRAGDAAAERLAGALSFTEAGNVPSLDDAVAAGRELVETIQRKGPLPWWGRRTARDYYIGQTPRGSRVWVAVRAPIAGDSARGYEGLLIDRYAGGYEISRWQLGPNARTFLDIEETRAQTALGATRIERKARAERATPTGNVTQVVADDAGESRTSFEPGPAFLPSAAVELAQYQVATGQCGTCIIETSQLRGRGGYTCLLRPMPPDADGRARVLVQDDLMPLPSVHVFDDAAELAAIDFADVLVRRVTEEEAVRRFPELPAIEAWSTRQDTP